MENFEKLRELDILDTKKRIKGSVTQDLLVIQAITHIQDLNKVISTLVKDLREWYSYYNPEFSHYTFDHKEFVESILSRKDTKPEISMGSDFSEENLKPIYEVTEQIKSLFILREKQEKYVETMMQKICPNVAAIAGSLIGAKLMLHAGSLRRLAILPSSTVQLLGAEEALFRHLKTNARCPKYGVLHAHPLISKVRKDQVGKAARTLAGKISIAAKVDYMNGQFIGDKLMKEIWDKFK